MFSFSSSSAVSVMELSDPYGDHFWNDAAKQFQGAASYPSSQIFDPWILSFTDWSFPSIMCLIIRRTILYFSPLVAQVFYFYFFFIVSRIFGCFHILSNTLTLLTSRVYESFNVRLRTYNLKSRTFFHFGI